jgi:hypothetical protein
MSHVCTKNTLPLSHDECEMLKSMFMVQRVQDNEWIYIPARI